MRTSKTRAVVAMAATLALSLTACGSSDNGGGGGSGGGDKGPINIGVITSLSGQYSLLGGFTKKTLDLLAEQINADGGIDGRKVELSYADDQTNPTQAAIALRSLRDKDPVAIVGPVLSSSCAAIVDQVEQLQIPMVTQCATDSQVEPVRAYTFMATENTPAMTEQLGNYLKAEGKSKVAVLYDAGDFGKSGIDSLKKQGIVDIVGEANYQLSSTTFLPQLTGLIAKKPDAIIVWGAGSPLVTIAKEYSQLGSPAPLVYSAAAATPLFLGPDGAAANGNIMASSLFNVAQAVPDSNPSKAMDVKLAADYQAKYNEPASQFTADACGAWQVITEAIKKAGTDHKAVRDAIENEPAVGCHGTYKYSADDHRGLHADDVWVVVNNNGKLEPTQFSLDNAH